MKAEDAIEVIERPYRRRNCPRSIRLQDRRPPISGTTQAHNRSGTFLADVVGQDRGAVMPVFSRRLLRGSVCPWSVRTVPGRGMAKNPTGRHLARGGHCPSRTAIRSHDRELGSGSRVRRPVRSARFPADSGPAGRRIPARTRRGCQTSRSGPDDDRLQTGRCRHSAHS